MQNFQTLGQPLLEKRKGQRKRERKKEREKERERITPLIVVTTFAQQPFCNLAVQLTHTLGPTNDWSTPSRILGEAGCW